MEQIFKKINRFFYGKWHIAVLDTDRGRWIKEAAPSNIPYLKAENASERHILIQPLKEIECFYLLADDIDWSLILRHHKYKDGSWKPGRMVVETSPDNFQVWIHSANAMSLNEKSYWLKKLCSDPGAYPKDRWGRCPGFRNRKKEYCSTGNRYPLSKLIWIDWKNLANVPKTLSRQPWGECVTNPKAFPINSEKVCNMPKTLSHQPWGECVTNPKAFPINPGGVCQNSNISRSDYLRDDESITDFSYTMALIHRGCTDEEIEQRLRMERTNWNNHSGEKRMRRYLERTIRRARNIVGR